MTSLTDEAVRQSIVDRISKLRAEARPRWGRMTAPQMICHLNDSYRVSLGEKHASDQSSMFRRSLMKWVALYGPMQWPKGLPTLPEVKQGVGGTCPTVFDTDRDELIRNVKRFAQPDPEVGRHPHPLFGLMSEADWMRWGYLHADHHLRQFGV